MDLVCFSHLQWNLVYQRPQHLLSRAALQYRVFYIQEFSSTENEDGYSISLNEDNVWIVMPYIKDDAPANVLDRKRTVIDRIFQDEKIATYILWFYMHEHF